MGQSSDSLDASVHTHHSNAISVAVLSSTLFVVSMLSLFVLSIKFWGEALPSDGEREIK